MCGASKSRERHFLIPKRERAALTVHSLSIFSMLTASAEREGVGGGERVPPAPTKFQFARGYNDLRK